MSDISENLAEEDRARADLYALFARLFYAGPDERLLRAFVIADAVPGEGEFLNAWAALAGAAREIDAQAAAREYESVFAGSGKAGVSPYASGYLAEAAREGFRTRLRDELDGLGLTRAASGPEDHIAALFEVMRHLIVKTGPETGSVEAALHRQAGFFDRYLAHSYPGFIDAIEICSGTSFYKAVARCARAFLDVESQALGMSD